MSSPSGEAPKTARRAPGRHSTFDQTQALDIALDLFWRHGYEGVSIADLTAAIGIAPPSLYHAFGSKADLYREVLRRYGAGGISPEEIAEAKSAFGAAQDLLRRGAEAVTAPGRPLGCMVSSGMLTAGAEHSDLVAHLREKRAATRDALEHRIATDMKAGILPTSTDAGALARYTIAVLQGLSVQAIDGASRDDLARVAETALRAWPSAIDP